MRVKTYFLSAGTAAIALATAAPAYAGEIIGSVLDEGGEVALQAAQLRIVELDRVAVSERDGSFLFADLPAGTYTLEARYVGASPVAMTVTVPASGALRVDVPMTTGNGSEILVIGQAANLSSALSRKRESDVVSDVLTRDAIGQFPDQNVAESLRRLPGVNVLNDQGEGRFVSVRGLDPELNSTSLNGVRLPAPESDVRSVALDVVSSDIIESIEVKKSLTPDMDADTIGASVEIETTSAFDRKKDLISLKLEGSYNDYAGEVSPKGSVDFATLLSENIGVAGGISYYRRRFETDNIEADDWVDEEPGVYAQEVQYRDYDVERERISATLGFDFRVDDSTELYVKGIYSQFDDQEYRRRTTFDLGKFEEDGDDSAFPTITGTTATFSDDVARIGVERDIKDRFESQKIRSVVLGGETDTGDFFAEYSASWAKSTETENGSMDPAEFRKRFSDTGLSVMFDYADPRVPLYTASGNDDFFNPSEYELKDIEYVDLSNSQDEEFALKLDLGKEFYTGGGTFTVQAGGKARWREKSYNKEVSFWENDALTLADVLGEQTYRIIDMGPVASYEGATDYFLANMGDFEPVEEDTFNDSVTDDYTAKEDVLAGYLLGKWESTDLRVIGGVRYEHTSTNLEGKLVNTDDLTAETQTFENDYGQWLPSLNIRYEPVENMVLRAAGYRSLVRPKLKKMSPTFQINEDDEAEFGNPDLKPYEAWNFDASAEYYFNTNGAISAAVFYKDIKNFIVDTEIDETAEPYLGMYQGVSFTEAELPINGENAEVFGIELSLSQAWTQLPAPFDGLITQVNYTYTDASGMVPVGGDITDLREISLPSTSKHTLNGVLGYEKGPISLRLAGTYRDSYLDELGGDAAEDRFVDDHFQLDFSAKYRITDGIQLFYEWVNINDAKYFAYNNVGGQQNLYQYERYNWTMKFGAKVTF